MKKTTFCFIFLLMIVFSINSVFAGSVPEDFLGDTGDIFFAKVVDFRPKKEKPYVVVQVVKNIKGNNPCDKELVFYEPAAIGNIDVNERNIYLFAHFDENNPTYIFNATSYDTKTLKLKGIDGMDMWERFEEYLNQGKYESTAITDSKENTDTALPVMNPVDRQRYFSYIVIGIMGVIAIFALIKKRPQEENKTNKKS